MVTIFFLNYAVLILSFSYATYEWQHAVTFQLAFLHFQNCAFFLLGVAHLKIILLWLDSGLVSQLQTMLPLVISAAAHSRRWNTLVLAWYHAGFYTCTTAHGVPFSSIQNHSGKAE